MVDILLVFAIVIPLIVILWAILTSLRIVRPTEKGLVERFGKYHRFVEGGITLLVPFVDKIIKVNVTERMTPVQRQDVITKDKVFMGVDAVVFYRIKVMKYQSKLHSTMWQASLLKSIHSRERC